MMRILRIFKIGNIFKKAGSQNKYLGQAFFCIIKFEKERYKMKKLNLLIALIVGLLLVPQVSFAESLEEKVARLEEKVAGLEENKGSGLNLSNVSISGLIEIDAVFQDDDQAPNDDSDIALATVELGIDAKINENVEGHILFLYEEDTFGPENANVIVDEGTITITSSYGLSLTAGKMYVPFGMFNSHFITDPMTLDLGETRETAVLIGYGNDMLNLSVGVYNGDVDEASDDNEIDDFVASLTVTPMEGITFGASYISDIADTDADITGLTSISDTVAGYSAFLSANFGPLTFEAEYLAAADEFQLADFDANADSVRDEPSAINLELAMALGEKSEVAVRWEESDEAGSYKDRVGVAAACEIYDNTTVIFEYMTAEYDDNSGNDIDTITAELAIEF